MMKVKVSNGMAGVGDRVMYKYQGGNDIECVIQDVNCTYDIRYPVYCKGVKESNGWERNCYCSYEYAEKNLVLLNTFSEEGIKELFDILLSD